MDIQTRQGIYKSKGGLIRSFVSTDKGKIKEISISGDFFLFPEESFFRIAEELKGIKAKREEVKKKSRKSTGEKKYNLPARRLLTLQNPL